jgi:phosphate-selective porin OprO/OprP
MRATGRRAVGFLMMILAGWLTVPPASPAQAPLPPLPASASPPPGPVPGVAVAAAAPADLSPAQMAERLRRLEEANQRVLEQYQVVSRQNAELSKTVSDLSRRLESVSRDPASTVPAGGAGAAMFGNDTGPAGEDPPLTGGLTSPSSSTAPKKGRERLPLEGYYDQDYRERYGFVFRSKNEEYELRVNGELQVDSRNYTQTKQNPVINDFDIPRARIYFSGRLTKPIEYQLSFQRSTNNFDLLNAFFNFRYDERFQLRIGRFRAPYTYEWAKLSNWEFLQPERSPFAANFGPNRQVGFMEWGNLFTNRLEYAAGMFDGPRNSYSDTNSAKDFMAFVDYRPFVQTESALKFLSVGGSVDVGDENNPLVPAVLRTSTNGSANGVNTGTGDSLIAIPFLAFNNNVRERGARGLWELHATYFYKGLSVLGAWDSGFNDFALTTPGARPVHLPVSGWHVQTGYLLTGETIEKRGLVEPLHPFDLRKGKFGPGAWELQARYSTLAVGRQVFTSGLADPNLWTNSIQMVDAGFNWYLNRNIKVYFDWEHVLFGQPVYYHPGPGLQKTSDLLWLRLQYYF